MNTKFDVTTFRSYFPAITDEYVYLDSASTSLKPQAMINSTIEYYSQNTANILRSKHASAKAITEQCEHARFLTAQLINAASSNEIIWTKGATESLNFIAQTYAKNHIKQGDEIIVSELEHHSNLIPWLQIADQSGAIIIKWQVESDGSLSLERLASLLNSKTRLVAVTQMSNVTGESPDIRAISSLVHQYSAVLVVDGAQGIVHTSRNGQAIDVQRDNVDFYVFSAHKLYGPTGLGILYGKTSLLKTMPCWHGGGKMLKSTDFYSFIPADHPYQFEAGTLNIAAIVGFYGTLNWLAEVDLYAAELHTQKLVEYTKLQLRSLKFLKIHNVAKSSLFTFSSSDFHHDDLAILIAEQNVAIRSGELCAQPLINALQCQGVVRASFMPYNTQNDADKLVSALRNAIDILM